MFASWQCCAFRSCLRVRVESDASEQCPCSSRGTTSAVASSPRQCAQWLQCHIVAQCPIRSISSCCNRWFVQSQTGSSWMSAYWHSPSVAAVEVVVRVTSSFFVSFDGDSLANCWSCCWNESGIVSISSPHHWYSHYLHYRFDHCCSYCCCGYWKHHCCRCWRQVAEYWGRSRIVSMRYYPSDSTWLPCCPTPKTVSVYSWQMFVHRANASPMNTTSPTVHHGSSDQWTCALQYRVYRPVIRSICSRWPSWTCQPVWPLMWVPVRWLASFSTVWHLFDRVAVDRGQTTGGYLQSFEREPHSYPLHKLCELYRETTWHVNEYSTPKWEIENCNNTKRNTYSVRVLQWVRNKLHLLQTSMPEPAAVHTFPL